jgi:ribosomal protein S18 acetylase RimI-like enzyme
MELSLTVLGRRPLATPEDAPWGGGTTPALRPVPSSRSTDVDRDVLLSQLVSIEKKHWSKSQSWGDQLPTLVSKPNAYVFLVTTEAGGNIPVIVSYAIVYLNSLHAQLSKVFTLPGWRGLGVATGLVECVVSHVRRARAGKGQYSVTLFVERDNEAAQRVYGRVGFEREGLIRDYYGCGSDAYRMQLRLIDSS